MNTAEFIAACLGAGGLGSVLGWLTTRKKQSIDEQSLYRGEIKDLVVSMRAEIGDLRQRATITDGERAAERVELTATRKRAEDLAAANELLRAEVGKLRENNNELFHKLLEYETEKNELQTRVARLADDLARALKKGSAEVTGSHKAVT